MIIFMRMFRQFRHEHREVYLAISWFSVALVAINIVMMVSEKLDFSSAFWFSIVTATTVGYGDISPATTVGRLAVVIYMLISIGALGTMLTVGSSEATEFFSKKKRGLVKVKVKIDLLIIGYPNEAKVQKIVHEFRMDKRFADASVAVVTDRLEERPAWMATDCVHFTKGLASKKEILEQANIYSTDRVLVLANDPFDEASDEFSSSAVIMCERLHPEAYTIAEKVREDGYLFEIAECDNVVSVSRAGELVQELQDPGAIEFAESIFSNSVVGNQYNMTIQNERCWRGAVIDLMDLGVTAIGYKNLGDTQFNFTPDVDDYLKEGAVVKYIADAPLEEVI